MFAELKSATAGIALLVVAVAGAAVGWSGAWAWADAITIPAERSAASAAGRAASDAEWKTKLEAAEANAEAQRVATQGRIAGIERSYLKQMGDRAAELSALEAQLSEERADDAEPTTPAAGTPRACRPAMSRGVRDQLARIGRAAPRRDPAEPDAGVPGRR